MDNQAILDELAKLRSELNDLSQQFYKNNFSASQTFTKDCVFTARMQAPHYSGAPAVGTVGDLIEIGGKLYICTTAGDIATPAIFTLVGSQV